MLISTEQERAWKEDSPLQGYVVTIPFLELILTPSREPEWAPHLTLRSTYLLKPRVTCFFQQAHNLPRLKEISLAAWHETPLSRRQTRIYIHRAAAPPIDADCRSIMYMELQARRIEAPIEHLAIYGLPPWTRENAIQASRFHTMLPFVPLGGLVSSSPSIQIPSTQMHVPEPKRLIFDSGKLAMLDNLLMELKSNGHRCLIYFQMTRMIDLMEEYMIFRQYKYLRLDGDTRLEDRRDMVMDWQQRYVRSIYNFPQC
jgi:chromatin-remodeling ATPase INO80